MKNLEVLEEKSLRCHCNSENGNGADQTTRVSDIERAHSGRNCNPQQEISVRNKPVARAFTDLIMLRRGPAARVAVVNMS
jgi:hypothetical protein